MRTMMSRMVMMMMMMMMMIAILRFELSQAMEDSAEPTGQRQVNAVKREDWRGRLVLNWILMCVVCV